MEFCVEPKFVSLVVKSLNIFCTAIKNAYAFPIDALTNYSAWTWLHDVEKFTLISQIYYQLKNSRYVCIIILVFAHDSDNEMNSADEMQ